MNVNDTDLTGRPEEKLSDSNKTYATSGIMLSAIAILFVVVILMVFFNLYARWYLSHGRRRRRSRNLRATMALFATDPSAAASEVISHALDPTVLKSLPIFTFSNATHKDPIDCAVCMSEFEENESGRVLPNCKHIFHVECIDMWFRSHSTCPLCRSVVEPLTGIETPTATSDEQVVIAISPDAVSATEQGSSSQQKNSSG